VAATPEDAVRMVDKQIAAGADIVKLYVVTWLRQDGKIQPSAMPLSVIKAATDEAHRKGKLVLAGHVDVLAHTAEEPASWDSALSTRLRNVHVTLIPTLTLFSHDRDFDLILKEEPPSALIVVPSAVIVERCFAIEFHGQCSGTDLLVSLSMRFDCRTNRTCRFAPALRQCC
jgi:hypothetical protein